MKRVGRDEFNKDHPLFDIPILGLIAVLEKAGAAGLNYKELLQEVTTRGYSGERICTARIYDLRRMDIVEAFLKVGGARNIEIKFFRLTRKGIEIAQSLELQKFFRTTECLELSLREAALLQRQEELTVLVQGGSR